MGVVGEKSPSLYSLVAGTWGQVLNPEKYRYIMRESIIVTAIFFFAMRSQVARWQ